MSRIPFVAAVVGALLIGGATTGGTHASWTNGAQLASSTVNSGSMDFSLSAPGTLAALDKTTAAQGTATFVATDTGVGKNLVQRISATIVSKPAGVDAYVAAAATCADITSASDFVDKRPSDAARSQTFCVRVVSSAGAVSGNVTLSVSGAQRPTGWSTSTRTVTIPVTLTAVGPAAPTITCLATNSDPNARTFTWTNLGSGVTYQLYRQGPGATSFTPLGAPISATTWSENSLGDNLSSKFQIKAVQGGLESAFSSTVTIDRNGASKNYNCQVNP